MVIGLQVILLVAIARKKRAGNLADQSSLTVPVVRVGVLLDAVGDHLLELYCGGVAQPEGGVVGGLPRLLVSDHRPEHEAGGGADHVPGLRLQILQVDVHTQVRPAHSLPTPGLGAGVIL